MSLPVYQFGDFRLDCGAFELFRNGHSVRVERKPMELLILLVSRQGQLVTRPEIAERLWSSEVFVDTEHGINTAVRKLRYLLRDAPEAPKFIQTVTGMGYRFIGAVDSVQPGLADPREDGSPPDPKPAEAVGPGSGGEAEPEAADAEPRRKPTPRVFLAAITAICLLAMAWLFRPHYPRPRITSEIQLTADGIPKWGALETDGLRVYFTEFLDGRQTIAAVPIAGGQVVPLKLPFSQASLFDISPDKADLLVSETSSMFQDAPLWRVPIIGGTPRRLGSIVAHDATWSPDGTKLAYVVGSGLYLANADGSDSRVLRAPTGVPDEWAWRPVWSPDSRRLRFCYYEMEIHKSHEWEINSDGSNPHVLFAASADMPMQAYGEWTTDGKYFVLSSWKEMESGIPWPAANLWAIREKVDPFHRRSAPANLTTGPIRYFVHILSSDGKTIFALSSLKHGELMRYDPHTKSLSPYASGLSAEGVSFSRDGKWVAYVKYPQGELWRSRIDGSEPLQLSSRPLFASTPAWSPDGTQIAFNGSLVGEPAHSYLVSADGGGFRRIDKIGEGLDPTWSQDGSSLVFMDDDHDNGGIRVLNLQTGSVVPVPESKTLIVPRTSPDGRWIVALSKNLRKLVLFDMQTQAWRELAQADSIEWPTWSRDSRYVYFERTGPGPEIFRIAVKGGTPKVILSLKDLHTTGEDAAWFSLTPDGDVLLLRDTGGGTEIYALSWDAP